jgi:hypothetical protein
MSYKAAIHVTFSWTGTHYWPEATGRHEYLKHEHRHKFECSAWIETGIDGRRELEFFEVQDFINTVVYDSALADGREWSCEQFAKVLVDRLIERFGAYRATKVEVMEDGENGAFVKWRPEPHEVLPDPTHP